MTTRHFSCFGLLLTLAATAAADSSKDCVYTLYVKTGDLARAGTDSQISVAVGDSSGKTVRISNLEEWGLMSASHNYFQTGNVDIFSGRERCISPPICELKIASDGKGHSPAWFLEYIEVTFTGPHVPCSQSIAFVNQWLGVGDPPFEVTFVSESDLCKNGAFRHDGTRKGPFVLSKGLGSSSSGYSFISPKET